MCFLVNFGYKLLHNMWVKCLVFVQCLYRTAQHFRNAEAYPMRKFHTNEHQFRDRFVIDFRLFLVQNCNLSTVPSLSPTKSYFPLYYFSLKVSRIIYIFYTNRGSNCFWFLLLFSTSFFLLLFGLNLSFL